MLQSSFNFLLFPVNLKSYVAYNIKAITSGSNPYYVLFQGLGDCTGAAQSSTM